MCYFAVFVCVVLVHTNLPFYSLYHTNKTINSKNSLLPKPLNGYFTNNVVPDEMQHYVSFRQGLHILYDK